MRTRLAISILTATLLAACGGSAPGPTTGSGATGQPEPATTEANVGDIDCAAIRAATQQLIGLQLLAQLSSPESLETIKSVGNLDLDALLAALDELHALDGVSTPLGDAKASLAFYEHAAEAAKILFDMDPVTQAALDAYNDENVGTVADFLGKQIAISSAVDEAGC